MQTAREMQEIPDKNAPVTVTCSLSCATYSTAQTLMALLGIDMSGLVTLGVHSTADRAGVPRESAA